MRGVWLEPVRGEHVCRRPILWPFHVRTGDRWKCTARLHEGEACGRIWRVTEDANGRMWTPEDEARSEGWKVFRPVTDEQLTYWLEQELGSVTASHKDTADVLAAIRKHFEIGSRK